MNQAYKKVLKSYFVYFLLVIIVFFLSLVFSRFDLIKSINKKILSLVGSSITLTGTLGYLIE